MRNKLRLIVLLLLFLQFCFVINFTFSHGQPSKKYLRWTRPTPGFRFNNQMYVLLGAMFMAVESHRTIIPSAGFNLKTDNLKSSYCNISDIFNLPSSSLFETNTSLWVHPGSGKITHPEDIYYSNDFIVDSDFDEMYFYVDGRVGTYNYLEDKRLCHFVNEFQLSPQLQSKFDDIMKHFGTQLRQSIGIHLRFGDHEKAFCKHFWWDLRFFVYTCFPRWV